MKSQSYDEQDLVQLATRIPRSVARSLKEHCVRHDVRMQAFVRSALAEKLARANRSGRNRPPA